MFFSISWTLVGKKLDHERVGMNLLCIIAEGLASALKPSSPSRLEDLLLCASTLLARSVSHSENKDVS
jgi:hypothetical protein